MRLLASLSTAAWLLTCACGGPAPRPSWAPDARGEMRHLQRTEGATFEARIEWPHVAQPEHVDAYRVMQGAVELAEVAGDETSAVVWPDITNDGKVHVVACNADGVCTEGDDRLFEISLMVEVFVPPSLPTR